MSELYLDPLTPQIKQYAAYNNKKIINQLVDYATFCASGYTAGNEENNTGLEYISVQDLKKVIQHKKENFTLLDVRKSHEKEIASIECSELIPLDKIETGEAIDLIREIILLCRQR